MNGKAETTTKPGETVHPRVMPDRWTWRNPDGPGNAYMERSETGAYVRAEDVLPLIEHVEALEGLLKGEYPCADPEAVKRDRIRTVSLERERCCIIVLRMVKADRSVADLICETIRHGERVRQAEDWCSVCGTRLHTDSQRYWCPIDTAHHPRA